MNESDCNAMRESVQWSEFRSVISLIVLLCIDVLVIAGNTMVIMAVYFTSKLRSVTNLFIVSLAVADLMVGLAVLPFSATWEVFKVWIFGDLWCSAWLATDVWMCTASILNLCAISLDRYIAVTRPVTYPSIMSMTRAKILVACVWVLSFVICLPPLIGWKEKDKNSDIMWISNGEWNETVAAHHPSCPWICELTSDTGYVVYSALGSFYIPMFVMLFFYWRIYRAAVQTTQAINQGFRTTKTRNRFDDTRLTLRIHRGKSYTRASCATLATNSGSGPNSVEGSPCIRSSSAGGDCKLPHHINNIHLSRQDVSGSGGNSRDRIKISVSYPSSDCLDKLVAQGGTNSNPRTHFATHAAPRSGSFSGVSANSLFSHYCPENNNVFHTSKDGHLRVRPDVQAPRRCSAGDTLVKSCRSVSEEDRHSLSPYPSPSHSLEYPSPAVTHKHKLLGKRNIKSQVRRFRVETKAAKTLAIIVGGFIFCWLPFFTLYLVRAFCKRCVHPLAFSIMFWLGYCNSALNPMIYALFSKDFRFAFQRIIYSCFSTNFNLRDSAKYRRGSDGSHLDGGGAYKRSDRSPSYNDFPLASMAVNSESEPPFETRCGFD